MKYNAKNIDDLLSKMPEDRRAIVQKLRQTVETHLPKGFEERLMYDMITFVVPLKTYPKGYLNQADIPLPFISITSQKNHIALYHSAIYMDEDLLRWFENAYQNHSDTKLNMGKSCIRFKPQDAIPYDLIGELASKITPKHFIDLYERVR